MAYVGARVVYPLGTEVKRARELGSYQLEEKLGEGGMGEVWRARHRMLARPAAIKLIRPSLAGDGRRRRVGGGDPALRARGAGDRPAPLAPHGGAVRLRRRRRRRLLLRHGAARRPRRRHAAPALRAHAARAGDLPAAPGLSFAVRGGVLRPGAPRHQAREHLPLPLRRGVRLREGAGFRHREGACTRPRRRTGCDRARTPSRARPRSSHPSRRWAPLWTGAPTSTPPAAWPTGC